MLVLALDSALAQCSAAVVLDGVLCAVRQQPARQGHAALLAVIADEVLHEAGIASPALDLIAVTVGPGSFTGIRAGLALAHGIGLGAGVPVVGVTVGEALADSLPHLGVRRLWTAIDSRRGRVFLERDGAAIACDLGALPCPCHPVAVAGDAAIAVAARLAARGADVMLTDARLPMPRHVAVAGARRLAGELPALSAQPLYVDPPEARLPAGGLRPPPVAA
ncbi:MAG TPA: tRNA (adenosine(37)-N6)-threonylcarbamoyltransferase complex dimerization subunit type 1 TsaB [Acetobacteraceae bacterium]|nr:tRNA (adenosine(37)-N6)-threonylcarbamoyltransferase complex dimerization subunit type 1 TsaB [Acetobacteraceae bacterium]